MESTQNTIPNLMRLMIPKGWSVADNKFYDAEPILDDRDENKIRIKNWGDGFIEDVLWLYEVDLTNLNCPRFNYFEIELGWYPHGNIEGQYGLNLLWKDNEGERIDIERFESMDRFVIRDKIEEWLNHYNKCWYKEHYEKELKKKNRN